MIECKRAHPGERAGLGRALAPAHRFRPRKGADDDGQDFREHVDRRPPRLLDQRDIEVALLGVLLDRRLGERGQPRALEETLHRRLGRADARALLLLLEVGLAHRNALDGEREPARRDERGRALIDEAGFDQPLGDELLQILRRPRLHARRDFLGEQFEQKIGHLRPAPSPACGGGLGEGEAAVRQGWSAAPSPTLPRKREREKSGRRWNEVRAR